MDSYISVQQDTDAALDPGTLYSIVSSQASKKIGEARLIKVTADAGLYEIVSLEADYQVSTGDFLIIQSDDPDVILQSMIDIPKATPQASMTPEQAYHLGKLAAEESYQPVTIGLVGGGVGFLFGLIGVAVGFLPVLAAPEPLPDEYAPGLSGADSVQFAEGYGDRAKRIQRTNYFIGGGVGALGAGLFVASQIENED